MCLTCTRGWTVLHVLWSFVYVCCGAAQLVSGIFLFVSVPSLHLSSNLWVGTWDILIGIGTGMLACFCSLSRRRQEILLYLTISILIANAINVVITEWIFYINDMKEMVGAHRYTTLIEYACWTTRASSAILIFTSFLDAQLSFCSIQTAPKPPSVKMKKPPRGSHEQVSDIEYIIPRRKSSKPQSTATVCNAYSQSWVYDAETVNNSFGNTHHHHQQQNGNSSYPNQRENGVYLTLPQEDTIPSSKIVKRKSSVENVMVSSDKAHLIDNPVVHIEEASDDSNNSNNDRKLCYMKSFSRSTSPVIISPSSSQISLNNPPPIYECLQKLTEPEIYRTRLTSALSNKSDEYQAPQPVMVRTTSPQVEKVQYASLMKELEKVIVNKKEPSPPSSNNQFQSSDSSTSSSKQTCSSKTSKTSKNSDAEFSKELEAALQLIQDLESPNTIETPSEHKIFDPNWRNSATSSEDEKTLAEIVTPTDDYQPEQLSTFKPPPLKGDISSASSNGKGACIIIHSESQSTSGYSSPTHKTPNWSTTSSVNSSNNDHNLDLRKTAVSYTIRNTQSAAVISIYNSTEDSPKTKNVTLVNISGDVKEKREEKIQYHPPSLVQENNHQQQQQQKIKKDSTNLWNVKSLLRKKKNNKPKMCPELEGAIIKSESLAYLSENELLARHQRNKDIHRQIEQRVLQQLGTPRNESQC